MGDGRAATVLATGVLASLAVLAAGTTPVQLTPGGPLWRYAVRGAGPGGMVREGALLMIPGVDRTAPLALTLEAAARDGGLVRLGVATGEGPLEWQSLAGMASWPIPAGSGPGLLLRVRVDGEPARLSRIEVGGPLRPALLSALLALLAGLGAGWLIARLTPPPLARPMGLLLAGGFGLAATPLVLWLSVDRAAGLLRAILVLGLIGAGTILGLRRSRANGTARWFGFAAALLCAALFGTWARACFAPSLGSWDVDYWKACARRVTQSGWTRAYGGPDAVPPGHFLLQLRGREAPWEAPSFGKTFVIDQPPGIQALWGLSWLWAHATAVGLAPDEVENVAAKLPPLLGDLLAVGVLLWAFRERPARGAALAALYWALPISWLSSAVMGYFDGTMAPLAVAALVAAGRGRASLAGVLLALAALVKSTALLVAPAVAVALWTARAPIARALGLGAALVGAVLVPFALDGTLVTAVVHCVRILVQRRLAGGYGNGWWILSWLHGVRSEGLSPLGRIPFVETHVLAPLPVNAIGTMLFLLLAWHVARLQARHPGPGAAALAGAMLIVGYGQLAIGVHENHPHALVLAFLATGLASPALRRVAAIFLASYVLNMLALSGLGRFSGLRHAAFEPVLAWAPGFRMSLGIDLTLLLAFVNVATFLWLLRALPVILRATPPPSS
jgi:hypothetical protein